MRYLLAVLTIAFLPLRGNSQDICSVPQVIPQPFVHGAIHTCIGHRGNYFLRGDVDKSFSVALSPESERLNTIFSSGLWLGSKATGQEPRVAATRYAEVTGKFDYYPGPLHPQTGEPYPNGCANFNRSWQVYGFEIRLHQLDFADNGEIDNPIPSILAWPGVGNSHFEAQHGFALPAAADQLAPFADTDNDGIYDPLAGDYPVLKPGGPLPELMIWHVFNDVAGPRQTVVDSDPLAVEVRSLVYALPCEEPDDVLQRTLFSEFEIVNRGDNPLDSFYLAYFIDFDLGCYFDDYLGTHPQERSVFVYNASMFDGGPDCNCGGHPTFCMDSPVQSVTLLNRELDHALFTTVNPLGTVPPHSSSPVTAAEYYHYLSGRWRDGTPVTFGGDGHQTGDPTPFVFPDDPRVAGGWSMREEGSILYDRRFVAGTYTGTLESGASTEMVLAHTLHYHPDSNYFGQFSVLYDEIEWLNNWYEGGSTCPLPELCTGPDCVWPGDANNDQVVDPYDLLSVYSALGLTGPARETPYNWGPSIGQDWSEDLPISGANAKHADAVGNGEVSLFDARKIEDYLGLRTPSYDPVSSGLEFPPGPELYENFSQNPGPLGAGEDRFVRLRYEANHEGLRALAFTFWMDTLYWKPELQIVSVKPETDPKLTTLWLSQKEGLQFSLASKTDQPLESQELIYLRLQTRDDYPWPLPAATTALKFGNPVAIGMQGQPLAIGGMEEVISFDSMLVTSTANVQVESFTLYPNPAGEVLHLKFDRAAPRQVHILDAMGRDTDREMSCSGKVCSLSLRGLPPGVYLVEWRSGNEFIRKRFVKN